MVGLAVAVLAQLAVVARAPIDTSQGVNFHAILTPDTVYVGQQATYQVGVFIDDQLRLRLRHNPEFIPPDAQGLLSYELAAGARAPSTRHAGRRVYEVHVFQRAFFPLVPGRYTIPSAQLVYSLPLSTSFFSREETHTLVAESLLVVVRAPPSDGRPSDYVGAVGDVTIAAHLDSAAARVGDPMLLTLSVAGRGDVKLFPRPAVAVPWGTLVPAQVRVRLDTTTEQVRGTKEFDWLVTPRDSGNLILPSVRYPYFDPYRERYEVAVTPPSALHVAPGALALGDTARTDVLPPLPLRHTYRGPPSQPFYETPLYLALAFAAPIPALVLAARRRRTRKPHQAPRAGAAALRALARRQQPADALTVRRAFVRALEERFVLPPTVLTDRGALTHALRLEGVTAATAEVAESVLTALDRGAFGVGEILPSNVCAHAYAAFRNAVAEARPRRGGSRRETARSSDRATVAVIMIGAVASAMGARAVAQDQPETATAAFAAGVKAYTTGNYRAAASQFAAVTQWAPDAPDAWANAGTAAWAAGDTADAVVGWQHAGRIDPLAHDVHDHLTLVRATQDGPIARLPRIPTPLAADAALGFWLVACAVATWRVARRQSPVSAISLLLAGCAIAAGVVGVRENEAAAARDLSVVDRGMVLYASPALDADHVARADAGDVARTLGRQGVWSRVRLNGDREGWVESVRLIPLERR